MKSNIMTYEEFFYKYNKRIEFLFLKEFNGMSNVEALDLLETMSKQMGITLHDLDGWDFEASFDFMFENHKWDAMGY